jgi:hypothetical protein
MLDDKQGISTVEGFVPRHKDAHSPRGREVKLIVKKTFPPINMEGNGTAAFLFLKSLQSVP